MVFAVAACTKQGYEETHVVWNKSLRQASSGN